MDRTVRLSLIVAAFALTVLCAIVATRIEVATLARENADPAVSAEARGMRARLSFKMNDIFSRIENGAYEEARSIAEARHNAGDAQASYLYGFMIERGLGGLKDRARAINLYETAAEAGVADAEYAMGKLAASRRRYEEAFDWFTRAAAQGHAPAQAQLAALYAEGRGAPRSAALAYEWNARAAEAGDLDGMFGVAVAHLTGAGVDLDYERAAMAFEKAALGGHGPAQYNLALLYDSRLLGEPDRVQTMRWLRAAAAGGMPAANVVLGLMVHEGGVDPEGAAPADYFQKAAEAGDPQGMFLYAVALAEGDGREQDAAAASQWLESVMAAHDAPRDLKAEARALRAKLTPGGDQEAAMMLRD